MLKTDTSENQVSESQNPEPSGSAAASSDAVSLILRQAGKSAGEVEALSTLDDADRAAETQFSGQAPTLTSLFGQAQAVEFYAGSFSPSSEVAKTMGDCIEFLMKEKQAGTLLEPEDLAAILHRSAEILDVDITEQGSEAIARRSRGTPRVANRLLRRVRDYASVRAEGHVDEDVADQALEVFEVDSRGLDKVDRAILESVIAKFGGGPVGGGNPGYRFRDRKDFAVFPTAPWRRPDVA